MRTNFVAARSISRIFGFCFDRPAVCVKPEMMRRLLVRETHHFIPSLHYPLMVLVLSRWLLLLVHGTHRSRLFCGLFLPRRGDCPKGQNRDCAYGSHISKTSYSQVIWCELYNQRESLRVHLLQLDEAAGKKVLIYLILAMRP